MPSLDGIRFLSYVFVFFFHALPFADSLGAPSSILRVLGVFELGWVGVDVFFVLSGFLITTGLLSEIGSEHYLRTFYTKRVLRIFPLYYAACVFSFFILPNLIPQVRDLCGDLLANQHLYFMHAQNWWVSMGDKRAAYLGHFWSLAIEEQFYLVWPLALSSLCRSRQMLRICVCSVVAVMLVRVAIHNAFGLQAAAFLHFATTSRIDSLLVGCILAMALSRHGYLSSVARVSRFAMLSIGIAFVYLVVFWPSEPFGHWQTQTFGYTVVAVGAAGLIALFQLPTYDQTILSCAPIAYLGRISYGLYVFHWPILAFSNYAFQKFNLTGPLLGSVFLLATFVTTIVFASASYHLFERRFLKLKLRVTVSRRVDGSALFIREPDENEENTLTLDRAA